MHSEGIRNSCVRFACVVILVLQELVVSVIQARSFIKGAQSRYFELF